MIALNFLRRCGDLQQGIMMLQPLHNNKEMLQLAKMSLQPLQKKRWRKPSTRKLLRQFSQHTIFVLVIYCLMYTTKMTTAATKKSKPFVRAKWLRWSAPVNHTLLVIAPGSASPTHTACTHCRFEDCVLATLSVGVLSLQCALKTSVLPRSVRSTYRQPQDFRDF